MYRVVKTRDSCKKLDVENLYPELIVQDSAQNRNQDENAKAREDVPSETIDDETILGRALEQAEAILAAARKEADSIKQAAREEGIKVGEEDGYRAGYNKAVEELHTRGQAEMSALGERIAQYISEVENEKAKVLDQYLDNLKDIAVSIGEKIVQISLKSSKDVVQRMILAATEKLKKTSWAKIYIGQGEDVIDVSGDTAFLRQLSRLSDNIKIIMMEEEPGICIVELPEEIIDISVGTQLENIKEILNNARL